MKKLPPVSRFSCVKNILLSVLMICSLHIVGQSDTIKSHKFKFDWELGYIGIGGNYSVKTGIGTSFGLGLNAGYCTLFLTQNYFNPGNWPAGTWDYGNVKFFFRSSINRYLTLEYSFKYSYTHFGESYCEPCRAQLYGFQIATILGTKKVKLKPMIAVVRSVEKPTIFVYLVPLVFNFKL